MRHLQLHVVHRAACVVLVCALRRRGVDLGRLFVRRRQEMEQQRLLRDLQQTEGLEHINGAAGPSAFAVCTASMYEGAPLVCDKR